jgi:molybdopterin converting factor small subunit
MQIELVLIASLEDYYPGGGGRSGSRLLDILDRSDVAGVVALLALPDVPRAVFVNGRRAAEDVVLGDGDRLAIFPPVAGG